jgi:hypothetical protein
MEGDQSDLPPIGPVSPSGLGGPLPEITGPDSLPPPGDFPPPDSQVHSENPLAGVCPDEVWDAAVGNPLDTVAHRHGGESSEPAEPEDPIPKAPSKKVLRALTALGDRAEDEWIRLTAGRDLHALPLIRDDLKLLRARLGEPGDPPLVQLLIDQYSLEWTRRTFFAVRQAETIERRIDATTREVFRRGVDDADRKLMQLTIKIATVRRLLKLPPPEQAKPARPSADPTAPGNGTTATASRRTKASHFGNPRTNRRNRI